MENLEIAKICHEANRKYCEVINDPIISDWEHAAAWQKTSCIEGVIFCRANPDAPASSNHESWLEHKRKEGWKYGLVKDQDKKEHPCFVPYEELPEKQKKKDDLFKAIVAALI